MTAHQPRLSQPFWRAVRWPRIAPWMLALLLFAGCASPGANRTGVATTASDVNSSALMSEYTPRDCPEISDTAVIVAQVVSTRSGAPRTQHPGLDLHVRSESSFHVIRVHFGDLGDGMNSCLPFNECKDMKPLPKTYPVETRRAQKLIAELKRRHYRVGKFTSWGIPWWPKPATGSNCGDAFLAVVRRLGIDSEVLPEMRAWIEANGGRKWAFDRGVRRPVDDFFRSNGT